MPAFTASKVKPLNFVVICFDDMRNGDLTMTGALDYTAKTGLDTQEETISDLLKAKNYITAAFGIWHLGHIRE